MRSSGQRLVGTAFGRQGDLSKPCEGYGGGLWMTRTRLLTRMLLAIAIGFCGAAASCGGMTPDAAIAVKDALTQEFVRYEGHPFTFEVPATWHLDNKEFRGGLRQRFENSYHADTPFSHVAYLTSFTSINGAQICIVELERMWPQHDDAYMDIVEKGMDAKINWGIKQGTVKRLVHKERIAVADHQALRTIMEMSDGSHRIIVHLYDPALPYQVAQLSVSGKTGMLAADEAVVERMLRTIKIDYTIHAKLGKQDRVLSKKLQKFFMVTEPQDTGRPNVVLIVGDPHWDSDAQWSLCQGLRVLFDDNPELATKSAFVAEGADAGTTVDVAPLLSGEPTPKSNIVQATLSSYLIGGYIAYDWIEGRAVPVLGAEDPDLYRRSTSLWLAGRNDAWSASVAMRNETIASSLLAARAKFDNPILFVGAMHVSAVDEKDFASGKRDVGRAGGKNRGIADWLADAGIGYISLVPVPNPDKIRDAKLVRRYKDLMTAQGNGTTDQYVAQFVKDLPPAEPGDDDEEEEDEDDGRVTVAPSPALAAKVAGLLLAKKSTDTAGKRDGKDAKGTKRSPPNKDTVGKRVSRQKQNRHVKGTKEQGKGGYFNSREDAQKVLDAYHSDKATFLGTTSHGHVVVQDDEVTGFNNNRASGFLDQATHVFMIKGTSSPSVVPISPDWKP
jgi:hypothetical protein